MGVSSGFPGAIHTYSLASSAAFSSNSGGMSDNFRNAHRAAHEHRGCGCCQGHLQQELASNRANFARTAAGIVSIADVKDSQGAFLLLNKIREGSGLNALEVARNRQGLHGERGFAFRHCCVSNGASMRDSFSTSEGSPASQRHAGAWRAQRGSRKTVRCQSCGCVPRRKGGIQKTQAHAHTTPVRVCGADAPPWT